MERDQVVSIFNNEFAADYDRRNARLAAFRDATYLLMGVILDRLPEDARILCVGAGTGTEISYLAERHAGWHFTAVEPSVSMIEVCRQRVTEHGFVDRCSFHADYLETLPESAPYDAATSLLVSHFILDDQHRTAYFREIAARLKPGGLLINSDLAGDKQSATYESLLDVWLRLLGQLHATEEQLQKMRTAYDSDVAFLAPQAVGDLIATAGFQTPVLFLQTGMIHGWYAQRL